MKVVVLLSGGLDSATVLAQALSLGHEVLPLTLWYGSKHNRRESLAAKRICAAYGLRWTGLNLPSQLFAGAGSSLIDPQVDQPRGRPVDLVGPDATEVPFRNANLLSAGTAFALTNGASEVRIGAHGEDSAREAYPDCTPEFMNAMWKAIDIGTSHRVTLVVPFQYIMRRDVVQLAVELMVPIEETWTCYTGGATHCGTCPACVERRTAFKDAGFEDKVVYRATLA